MMQSERVLSLKKLLDKDNTAELVSYKWDELRSQMQPKLDESLELRNFVFATDTSTTSNADVQEEFAWKNNVHLPKLCEIRDNLIAIYKSTWFPNDNWLKWEAYTLDQQTKEKRAVIEGYTSNKVRQSELPKTVGNRIGLDFIDYGNAFAEVVWRDDRVFDEQGIKQKDGYVGPIGVRISPEDIVFDLTAARFQDSPKIIRRVMTVGDVVLWAKQLQLSDPDMAQKITSALDVRAEAAQYSSDDFNKVEGYAVDGFGNYHTYLTSGFVEILDFRGSIFDPESNELKQDHQILVMDRRTVLKSSEWDSWLRDGGVYHCPYRERPDNLWGMGPLDNLVGLQYRIDHLQGAKDDNVDLHIHPVKVITGDPDIVSWGPDHEIRLGEGESIDFKSPDLSHLNLDTEINYLLQLMEEFAGSPKQSRGFRTAGEKTLGEVSLLESNSNRLFLDKAIKFETEIIEPMVNAYVEAGRRNLDGSENVQIFNSELGFFQMMSVTAKDLEADGILRPVGARHFGQRNQQLTNLMQVSQSQLWPMVAPHLSGLQLAELLKDNMQLTRFGLISEHAALFEAAEAQRTQQQIQRELEEESFVDTESDLDDLGAE
jgi:hypothetical protein